MKDGLFKTILYTILGIGIMTAIMTLTSMTTPFEGVYIQFAYGYLALFAGVAGAIPAAIVGFTGHVLFDLIYTDHLWLSWALSSGALGLYLDLRFVVTAYAKESFHSTIWYDLMSYKR